VRHDLFQLELPLPGAQPGSERQTTLADRLCDLLVRRGRPLEVGHVVAQILRVRGCPERLQRRLVAEIVDVDARLAWRGRDLVGLAPPGWASVDVRDASYCVVDLETTGGAAGRSKITEIGAVRMRAGVIEDRFHTLVDPGHEIPAPIMRITGITNEMLVGQPRIDEVIERFAAFVGDDVMVAHNAPFDLRFLNYERHRVSTRYFTQPWLDTLVMARRLLRRRVSRFNLATLAEWADTEVRPIHRALADAEATAEVLARLLDLLVDRGVTTLERAVTFGQTGGARHAHKLALADGLPQRAGVYIMRDRRGAPLYVGKARNIRRRVRSYFGPQGRHSPLVARALEAVTTIDHEETGSELGALLREARLIQDLRPPCNSRGTRIATRYIKLTAGLTPRLSIVADIGRDDATYFGPVRSDRVVRTAVGMLERLFPLRHHDGPAAQQRLVSGGADDAFQPVDGARNAELVGRLLASGWTDATDILGRRLADDPAVMLDDEGREGFAALLSLIGALDRSRSAARTHGVVVEEDGGRVHLTLVAWGRVVATLDDAGDPRDVGEALARLRERCDLPPAARGPADVVEAVILHEWFRGRADQPGVIRLRGDFAVGPVQETVIALVAELLPDGGARDEMWDAA